MAGGRRGSGARRARHHRHDGAERLRRAGGSRFGSCLQLEAFQINLTIVAALLTIIGYSLNDTIVTFDRLREIKGKSPATHAGHGQLERQPMPEPHDISRRSPCFSSVVILYFFGGEGIHSFAFAFLVGVIAGTYSTVYIAAPVLLWLSGTSLATAESQSACHGEVKRRRIRNLPQTFRGR